MEHTHDHQKVRDPVCGMSVDPTRAKGGTFEHDGKTYSFCNPRCREKFAADPARYLQAERAELERKFEEADLALTQLAGRFKWPAHDAATARLGK